MPLLYGHTLALRGPNLPLRTLARLLGLCDRGAPLLLSASQLRVQFALALHQRLALPLIRLETRLESLDQGDAAVAPTASKRMTAGVSERLRLGVGGRSVKDRC